MCVSCEQETGGRHDNIGMVANHSCKENAYMQRDTFNVNCKRGVAWRVAAVIGRTSEVAVVLVVSAATVAATASNVAANSASAEDAEKRGTRRARTDAVTLMLTRGLERAGGRAR